MKAILICDGDVEKAIELLLADDSLLKKSVENKNIPHKSHSKQFEHKMEPLPSCEYLFRLNYIHGLRDEVKNI